MEAPTEPSTRVALWEKFAAKAQQLGAAVERAASETAAAELLSRGPSEATPACTRGLAQRFAEVAARSAPLPEDEVSSSVVGAGVLAVAETGSVLLAEDNRDRGACFLAEHLWLLVRAADVVPTVDAALERVGALIRAGSAHVTLVSGPSRTADIERTLTIGVHGPGRLTVVVVDDEAAGEGVGA